MAAPSRPVEDPRAVAAYADRLQGSGRYCFTTRELAEALGGTDLAREAALRRLEKRSRIVRPRRGFIVIVPVEYRSAGSPPASWFIDELMAHLGRPYYVGLLSAAAIHGAAHQQPQVFQVVTDLPTRPIEVARQRIEFHRNRRLDDVPLERQKTETGSMLVSTPEATAVDLFRYAAACGHLGNVATVLVELAERIAPDELARVAEKARHPDAQRLGYVLERLGLEELAEPLADLVASRRRRPVLLQPGRDADDLDRDPRWNVVPNADFTADL